MATLGLKFLGGLAILEDGLPILGLKSVKGQAILCYLAVSEKRASRSALAGMFWTDMPEDLALMNLRKVLNRIKPLSAHLQVEHETLAFNKNVPYWLDVQEFEKAAADRSGIQRLEYAASLYKGDFLEGFDCDEIPSFAAWMESQRTRLRETAVDCLKTLIQCLSDQGNYPDAIQFSRQWLKVENWNEEAHRELMRWLSLSGQRSQAIKQYELCRRILMEELGVEPAPDTLELVQQIKTGEVVGNRPVLAPTASTEISAPTYSLPLLSTPLIGRQHEQAMLKTYLADAQVRLVSIAGAGGMGKTQLALSLAHEIARSEAWFNKVIFVSLEAVATRQHLIVALAGPLNLALSGARDPENLLLSFLQDKNFLIVLDNFEQLLPEADFLEKILAAAPGCKLLITTRERTRLTQEWVLDLYGLPYSENKEEVQLADTDSIRLFVQCARRRSADFSLEMNLAAVVRICQLVQGMPLGLELAASWVRAMTAGEIADQIAQNVLALTGQLRNLPQRHRSMQAMLDSSWHWLVVEEQTIMRKLAVFRAGFSLEAAKQVAGASFPVLFALVDKSFLSLDRRRSVTTRYEIHELVRQYAYGQLQTSGETETTHTLHMGYFLTLAEQAERHWDTAQEDEWLQHLELERSNLHAALRWAFEQGKAEILLRFNAALFTFWVYKSPANEAIAWLEKSLSLPWDESRPDVLRTRAKVLNVTGYAAVVIADYRLALLRFEEGLALYSRLEEQREIAWSLRGRAFVAMIEGNYAQAQPDLEQSLVICQEIQDEWGQIWSNYDLGYLAMAREDFSTARPLLEEARDQFNRHGNFFGEFRSIIAIATLWFAQGKLDRAAGCYREALAYQEKYQYSQFVGALLEGIGQVALVSGQVLLAAWLFGAAQRRRDTVDMARWFPQEAGFQRSLKLLHEQLAGEVIKRAWAEGCAMSTAEAVARAAEYVRSTELQ